MVTFANLEAVRSAASAHKPPFWNIVLSNSHFTYAEPSPAGLRFQAYTTLAYGGRGISYFTYVSPNTGELPTGSHRSVWSQDTDMGYATQRQPADSRVSPDDDHTAKCGESSIIPMCRKIVETG